MLGVEIVEPAALEDAMQSEHAKQWKQAMDEEMASLLTNRTWTLEKAPPIRRAGSLGVVCAR